MTMNPVESTNVATIGYEGGKLRVGFKDGSHYEWDGVTPEQFAGLMNATSKGCWLQEFRKGNPVGTPMRLREPEPQHKIHTHMAEGCCERALNRSIAAGKLDTAASFSCDKCGTEYLPRIFKTATHWDCMSDAMIIRR
jgi:hypothetical protein